jgi:filamentous hemagglutinin family protein
MITRGAGATTTFITVSVWNAVLVIPNFMAAENENVDITVPKGSSILIQSSHSRPMSGTLTSNGRVYVLNPNGITLSSSARISAPEFYASTSPSSLAYYLDYFTKFGEFQPVVNMPGNIPLAPVATAAPLKSRFSSVLSNQIPDGTAIIQAVAVNARWINYSFYLRKMIETVQVEWERILLDAPGSQVEVKFALNKHGKISGFGHILHSLVTSDATANACRAAIEARSPYGEWTDEMVATLGLEQEMAFRFRYK